ncbi:MAG TPA: tetratricopeptide repeat protein [Candidatus Acidoferrales bacterium]|nr:tetratricopeptide repeat protein [Candidatus Acidoferrales bacterium]
MAFNKNKALEIALKYLNQGKAAQAIAEYQQILRHDAKDQATLMTVGDLFARQGDMPHALEYFERLAQVYLNDGFNSKAIAIYKKIAKLAPAELAPLERLADLYVQQGVLSEARPLFLQIAEAHLKANRAPKAVAVLHRLLEVEPENPRVQMRLAELYNVMGQKKDAAKTYSVYAQRLFDRGDTPEAEKLIERALEALPGDGAALLLKARILAAAGKETAAIHILEKHPEADAGSDVTNLLVDLELKMGQLEQATDHARNQLVRGNAHFGLLFRVVETLVESRHASEAIPLFRELRDPMIEVGEHDKFVKALSAATDRLPENFEALELLADFCRHTSDPFPLTVALTKLVDLYATAGNKARAEELQEELVDRNRDDERLTARLEDLRTAGNGTPKARATPQELEAVQPDFEENPAVAPTPVVEEAIDPETQIYIAQALTDVDLFSSYGLTQKAAHLLDSILQKAPRHVPTLERLLDLSLGGGDDRRTAELAAALEQIHGERGDSVSVERFAELRRRFQKASGITDGELVTASSTSSPAGIEPPTEKQLSLETASASVDVSRETQAEEPTEFEIPLVPHDLGVSSDDESRPPAVEEPQKIPAGEEMDLSDEWEAMVQEIAEPSAAMIEEASPSPEANRGNDEIVLSAEAEGSEVFEIEEETAQEPSPIPEINIVGDAADGVPTAEGNEFELELAPETDHKTNTATTEEFIRQLAAEVEGMEPSAAEPIEIGQPGTVKAEILEVEAAELNEPNLDNFAPGPASESLNELSGVFQEFRSELGELGEEDEDLETHYNLGIAYREMGLLDEAIGEFQKVAKAVQKGKPFRYAMNCATLLALSFRDKGEPKIASLWYQQALTMTGLEQETILALRYDLGISLEMAGESDAALDYFRQVYAMNIDYRDVADRIATLQHR